MGEIACLRIITHPQKYSPKIDIFRVPRGREVLLEPTFLKRVFCPTHPTQPTIPHTKQRFPIESLTKIRYYQFSRIVIRIAIPTQTITHGSIYIQQTPTIIGDFIQRLTRMPFKIKSKTPKFYCQTSTIINNYKLFALYRNCIICNYNTFLFSIFQTTLYHFTTTTFQVDLLIGKKFETIFFVKINSIYQTNRSRMDIQIIWIFFQVHIIWKIVQWKWIYDQNIVPKITIPTVVKLIMNPFSVKIQFYHYYLHLIITTTQTRYHVKVYSNYPLSKKKKN